MKRLIVKVCGMRDAANIAALEALDVDWVGHIFYPRSPRHVAAPLPPYPRKLRVGVFVNADLLTILDAARVQELTHVQLHGEESPDLCAKLQAAGLSVIKAFPVGAAFDTAMTTPFGECCDYFLFDTQGAARGGNGVRFDWSVLADYVGQTPFLLSGGLGPDAVADLRAFDHPQWVGIDLNSRFEDAPALKNISLLKTFLDELYR